MPPYPSPLPHPTARRPLSLCLGSVYIFPPGSARGQRREGGPWTPGPAGSVWEGLGDRACSRSDLAPPCQHLCSLPGSPRPPGRPRGGWPPGSKGGREARGEALEMEAVGWGFPSLSPLPSPCPTQGLAMGRERQLGQLTALKGRHKHAPLLRCGLPWEGCVGSESLSNPPFLCHQGMRGLEGTAGLPGPPGPRVGTTSPMSPTPPIPTHTPGSLAELSVGTARR